LRQQSGRRIRITTNRRLAGSINAGFLETNRLPGIAKKLLVVEIDAGHYSAIRIPDVDRIKPSAETNFQHSHIQFGALKQPHCRQRALLEVGQRHIATRLLDSGQCLAQVGITRLGAIQMHPLVITQQMR